MKILNPSIFAIATLVFLSAALFSNAQVATTDYYYNNFESGSLGTGFTQIGQTAALSVSIPSASHRLSSESGYSLTSTGSSSTGGFDLSFIGNNTNLFNTEWGHEWTLLYRNNGGDTDNANTIDNGENAWKYWLFKDNSNQNIAKGYYLTQEGNTLHLRYQQGNSSSPVNFCSYPINNNTTYAIRAQIVKRGNENKFVIYLFVDTYDGTKNGAKTLRGNTGWEYGDAPRNYVNSSLLVSSTGQGRFVFDEMKMYSMKLLITGANDISNGISNPMYPGQKNAIFYGLQISTRGLFDIYQFQLNISGNNVWSTIETGSGAGKLYKSFDSYYGNADDVLVTNLVVYDTNIQHANSFSDTFCSVGNEDGTAKTVQYYYITLNVKTGAPSNGSIHVSSAPTLQSYNAGTNYASNTNTVTGVNTSTNPANSGGVKDWVGTTSSDWSVAGNWSPSGVPGANDLARIGEVTFDNQPVVTTNPVVGNIKFGTTKAAELTVNTNSTLTVNSVVENLEGVLIKGNGKLNIKGNYLAKPTVAAKTTISSIANLEIANFVLNTESKDVTFDFTGTNMLIKNAIQTTGANSATFTLGSNSTLTLEGAVPISLLSNNNTLTLNNGTVVYAANVQQTVPALSYKNISFSGTGLKRVLSGTLYISGDWNSSQGKIDLLTNNASLNFTGVNQAINDTGSDAGNGLFLGNLFFDGGIKSLSTTGKFNLAVGKYLTLGTNTVLQTSGNLTLKANELGSASVSAIPSSSSVQGHVTVERYVQGGNKNMWRTYRMFSSPVYDNGDPSNRTYSFTQFIDDMLVTGKAEGFDQFANSSTSAWTYNNGFVAIPDINTSVNIGRGAYLLYRGNRDNPSDKVSTPFVDAESIVMTYKGELNQQSITVPLEHGSTRFSMLGNPYAATIDWNNVIKTENVEYVIRTWNPGIRQYATYNGLDELNGGSKYIGPGQGFFVQTTDGNSPSVTFTEDAKVGGVAQVEPLHNVVMTARSEQTSIKKLAVQTTNNVQTATAVETPAKVRIKLTRDGYDNEDETLVVLKRNEPTSFAGYDVARSGGESVFLSSLSSEGRKMGINYMPHISAIQKVELDVNVSNNGDYKMQFALTDVPLGYEIKLNDKYLNTITDVTNEGTVYSLSIDRAVGSSLGDRFELLVAPSTTLPVTLVDFVGDKVNGGVLLKWQTSSEVDNSHFEIQRAGDDQAYINIGSVVANAAGSYNLLDKSPLNGNNYYRLVQIDNNGNQTTFPKLAQVKFDLDGTSGLLVYPTLVQSTFTMKFNGNLSSKQYVVKVADATGREVYSKGASKEEVYNGFIGELTTMPSGVYFATLLDSNNGNRLGVVKMIKK
ncbi:hypothetical protein D3C87_282090 [compost metagenome]